MSKRFRWGFQWGKVVTGGGMLLLGGGITLGGAIYLWPAAFGVVGLFILIAGLIGEEGVW